MMFSTRPTTVSATDSVGHASCEECASGLLHCHHVLVVHLDETAECAGFPACLLDPAAHDDVITCTEVGTCPCTSGERGDTAALPFAA